MELEYDADVIRTMYFVLDIWDKPRKAGGKVVDRVNVPIQWHIDRDAPPEQRVIAVCQSACIVAPGPSVKVASNTMEELLRRHVSVLVLNGGLRKWVNKMKKETH